ncbi:MAG: CusA/CzcA family heavy metal efflux RND transporter [Burkholderiales bacterium]|jgi:cobalt-zinc-cadmium resistance protein CzcA|nr:CusA/CzcA family heavy metal efflux RND transporter [Burkholderiales bacterium]
MLRTIVSFALSRRPIILLSLLVFLGTGVIAYLKLNIEAYPNPAPVILEITAQAPGLSAEEMERYYTREMEVGLATTPGVDNIRSTSFYGLSFVRVTFNYGIDYYFAYTQAALSLQQNVNLPNGVQPEIQASSLVGEIYRYQLVGPPELSLTDLRTLQDWVVERRLKSVPGVLQVVTWGGTTKQYDVEADMHKLEGYRITLPELIEAIGSANVNVGGRTLNIGEQSVNIRGIGLINNTEDIGNIVLSQSNGTPVLVKDVAKVSIGHVPRLGKAGRDDQSDVVTGVVVMNPTQQTNEVIAAIKNEVAKINADGTLPPGVNIESYYDRSKLVSITTQTVMKNLIFGCLLIFIIQWIFLANLRSAIIVGATIPFALFFAIIILVLTGESANLLSMGAVDFGIVVEATVILVENIFRNLQKKSTVEQKELLDEMEASHLTAESRARRGWTNRLQVIFASAGQVDKAILFFSLITIAAFIPLFTMQGMEGQIFGPMARTYAYALLGALIATFTITPVLASYLLPDHVEEKETILVRALRKIYTPTLDWALRYKKTTLSFGGVFLLVAGLLTTQIGTEFLPALEEGNLWIRSTKPSTISLEAGMEKVDRMRQILNEYPEVITVVSQHGRPDDGSDASGFSNTELFVPLKPFKEWPRGITKEKRVVELEKRFMDEFPGIEFSFSQYIQDNIQEQLSGVKGANSVKVIGPDLTVLEKISAQILRELNQIEGVEELGTFDVLGQPNLNITIDRAKAARYGLNVDDINAVVQAAAGGTVATTVLEDDRQFDLVVRLAPEFRSSIDAIRNIRIGYAASEDGKAYVPLSELATISLDTGASFIYREHNQRYIPVKFSVRGRDLGSTVAEAQERIKQNIALPQGYRIEWAGEFDAMQQAKDRLAVILPATICIILVLLYALFNSLRDSLLTLAAIPFSVAGGIIALTVTGQALSISAAIGFVSIFGVSVMIGILILTSFNQLISEGKNPVEAMRQAAGERMRPVLMVIFSACFGLLPAALSTGIGSQVQRPLATVVVSGLLIGTIVLLVVTPVLQVVWVEWANRRSGKKGIR